MELPGHIDHMVLFSGDGDFRSLNGMTRRECDDHSAPNSIAPRATP
jgi:uncharacterized LabA/DUF88 family protein